MKNKKYKYETIELFFRKMDIPKPEKGSDFEKFVNYSEKISQEKDNRIRILENCLKVSSDEIKEYIMRLEEKTLQLTQSNKMAAVGEMSASLSHEINNPLFIIGSNSDLIRMILENCDFTEKERIITSLDRIHDTVGRIKRISRTLKNLSNDRNNYKKTRVNIIEAINDSMPLYSEQLINSNISLSIGCSIENTEINLATIEFSQVMVNLITNAKQYIQDIEDLGQRYISIDISGDDDHLFLRIENGGPPIEKEIEDKIFESFFTTKDIGVGTGLGLSISRKIITKMGGYLYLEKDCIHPTFIIKLPLKEVIEDSNIRMVA